MHVRFCVPNRPHLGGGTVGSYVRSVLVEDASGAQFQIHEYLMREPVFGYARKRRRFELDTGEPAELADGRTFRIVGTGETLVRVSED